MKGERSGKNKEVRLHPHSAAMKGRLEAGGGSEQRATVNP